ncbi:unnamed protein product [Cyprideis torosa]|uniref:Protein arginine N-methyltransferase n=1 Tax=Cyprideis torosa TaxID=163714 RepID=A0A7R8ZHS2_9CRUS|nr:unnamed protein product [Cyprideis torosa]CAG0884407.1 unnamed protein product [Cyprideis torosa]
MTAPNGLSVGRELDFIPNNLRESLTDLLGAGYHFLTTPFRHPHYRSGTYPLGAVPSMFARPDTVLSTTEWRTAIVAKMDPDLDVDHPNPILRKKAEAALMADLKYAMHLSVVCSQICLKRRDNPNLARLLYSLILNQQAHVMKIWVTVPLNAPNSMASQRLNKCLENGDSIVEHDSEDTWQWWRAFRSLVDESEKFGLVLELTENLPDGHSMKRWIGEGIRCITVPTSIFVLNKAGFPVLPVPHQRLIADVFQMAGYVQFQVSGLNTKHHDKAYLEYMFYLQKKYARMDTYRYYGKGYEDQLQIPLQPLQDNLESSTYECFEQDPVKYHEYQRAIFHALQDRVPVSEKDDVVVVCMVLGAGRGPLVHRLLMAAEKAERKVKVYALEKNANAIPTLVCRNRQEWNEVVTLVHCDMRVWDPPEKADIVISELLGSFGDNELSPECLDGANKVFKPDGISIPQAYTSYLAPIQTPRVFQATRVMNHAGREDQEKPYVVNLTSFCRLAEPLPTFEFTHPSKESEAKDPDHNTRYTALTFKPCPTEATLHGFGGYFTSVLYKTVRLSIHPSDHSPGMFSWFPMYFPLQRPVQIRAGDRVTVHMWRLRDEHKVWYEWTITEPEALPIHNSSGKHYQIGF